MQNVLKMHKIIVFIHSRLKTAAFRPAICSGRSVFRPQEPRALARVGPIFVLTFIALLYVNQQALIYQMGLRVTENNKIYSKLVDRNRVLVYNVLNQSSPVSLETKLLAKNIDLRMPREWQVLKNNNLPTTLVRRGTAKRGLFASLFLIGWEAEASPNKGL